MGEGVFFLLGGIAFLLLYFAIKGPRIIIPAKEASTQGLDKVEVPGE